MRHATLDREQLGEWTALVLLAMLLGLMVVSVSGCSLLGAGLDQPVTTQPIDPATGLPGPAQPVMDEDGTVRTGGEALADRVEGAAGDTGSVVGGVVGAVTGNPLLGAMAAALLAQLGAGAATSLRKRHTGAAPPV